MEILPVSFGSYSSLLFLYLLLRIRKRTLSVILPSLSILGLLNSVPLRVILQCLSINLTALSIWQCYWLLNIGCTRFGCEKRIIIIIGNDSLEIKNIFYVKILFLKTFFFVLKFLKSKCNCCVVLFVSTHVVS